MQVQIDVYFLLQRRNWNGYPPVKHSSRDRNHVHVEKYRDTSGVGMEAYRSILNEVGRSSFKGNRDYAILRLLWDNALQRGEVGGDECEGFAGGQVVDYWQGKDSATIDRSI